MKRVFDKRLIWVLIGVIAFVGFQGYKTHEINKEAYKRSFNNYERMEMTFEDLLSTSEAYLIAYPLEGMYSQSQNKRRLEFEKLKSELPLRYKLVNQYNTYSFRIDIGNEFERDDIVSEMEIYFNRFESDRYPASEENLEYMNNLLLLMQELRVNYEEHRDSIREVSNERWFETEQYRNYIKAEENIHEKNNWEISAADRSSELGPKTEGIDLVETPYDSSEKAKEIAYAFLLTDFPELNMDDLRESGGGGSNILGRMFNQYEFEYNDVEVEVQNTGHVLEVRFGERDREDEDEDKQSAFSFENKDDQEKAIQMAQDYLKNHGYEKYSVIDDVSSRRNQFNIVFLPYTEYSYKNRRDTIDIQFYMTEKGIVMHEVQFPQMVYLEVLQTNNYETAFNNEERCKEKLGKTYEILSSTLVNDGATGNQMDYSWQFKIKVGEVDYIVEVDALTAEIENVWPE